MPDKFSIKAGCPKAPNRSNIFLIGAKQAQFKGSLHMPFPKFVFKFSGGLSITWKANQTFRFRSKGGSE
jgi:hypothetical protein